MVEGLRELRVQREVVLVALTGTLDHLQHCGTHCQSRLCRGATRKLAQQHQVLYQVV